ncbi:MAG: sterol desaturase family protein [Polymorphobacter sp.]|uniref:sterol desaturase family protein n=1 Tax=Polymorphobacter sp. TaxID=1909290 RepID=UPI003A835660
MLAGLVLSVGLLWLAEQSWPRRAMREPPQGRLPVNLALGAMSLAVVTLAERPLTARIAARNRSRGLLHDLAGVVLLDFATYLWHIATHRVPLLWRLHAVHHSDRDMDWTTALRFHAADMALSVPLRMAQVRWLGITPRALNFYNSWFFANVAFHHANLALPFDRKLSLILTTPGMHDIHHRATEAATDANYSSGFSLWDRLFGTFSQDRPDAAIGIPGWDDRKALGLAASLSLPLNGWGDSESVLPASPPPPDRRPAHEPAPG